MATHQPVVHGLRLLKFVSCTDREEGLCLGSRQEVGVDRGSTTLEQSEKRVVRKRGFEPLRYCYRQPLKLVRLVLKFNPVGRTVADAPATCAGSAADKVNSVW